MYEIKSFDFLGLAGFTFTLLTGREKKNLTHNSSKILLDKAFLCYTVSLRVSDWLKHFFVKTGIPEAPNSFDSFDIEMCFSHDL